MKFYLDTYNIIGVMDSISLADSNKVHAFIEFLKNKRQEGHQLIVIFDGQNPNIEFPTTEKLPGITIIHTSASRSADDYIKQKVLTKSDVSNITVVTSDRDIIFHAKKSHVKTMSSIDFVRWITHKEASEPSKKSPRITEKNINYWLNEFDPKNDK